MTKAVISGYYGFDNFGDEAILQILLGKLRSLGVETTVIAKKNGDVRTFDFVGVINAIRRADILISGGGSLLQDVTSLKSLLYYCWVIFTALCLRKKVIIFAQGIGPINSPFARLIVRNLLKKCAYISVRDEKSRELLTDWGIKSDLVCDPFYAMEMPERAKTGAVGVQLRGFKTMNDEFLKCLASAITKHFPGRKVEIYSLQDALDLEVCRKFQKLLNQPSTINHQLSIQETIDHIAQNEYMIAMRFHALLAALKSGVKPMAIDYDIKVRQLAQCNGLPMIELQPAADDDEKFEQLKRLEIKPLKSVFDWAGFENYAFW